MKTVPNVTHVKLIEDQFMNYVYIVECSDGTLYTGWTVDIQKRLEQHNRGTGAKYTRSRYPVTLRYWEGHGSKEEALKRECAIKKLSRKGKLILCESSEEKEVKGF
jgi:putative endonuclease